MYYETPGFEPAEIHLRIQKDWILHVPVNPSLLLGLAELVLELPCSHLFTFKKNLSSSGQGEWSIYHMKMRKQHK